MPEGHAPDPHGDTPERLTWDQVQCLGFLLDLQRELTEVEVVTPGSDDSFVYLDDSHHRQRDSRSLVQPGWVR